MLFSTWALAYILVYLLTGRLAVPGQEGTRFVTAREAADELDALVGDKEEAEDEA
ncbi:MAG: hypothetical protein H5T69_12350 [Chloroflexi bacterium]|nr:hypothetical protein [Chloroflexota bacterium]